MLGNEKEENKTVDDNDSDEYEKAVEVFESEGGNTRCPQ